MKKAVYTAIFGGKDTLKPVVPQPGWDYIVFTDNTDLESDVWRVVAGATPHADPTRNARMHKVLAHEFLPGYERSLWIDANIGLATPDLDALFDRHLAQHDVAAHAHPQRRCVYVEAESCLGAGKDDPQLIRRQMQQYRAAGYPVRHGLASTSVLFRRHTTAVAAFNAAWWHEIRTNSRRDQLSFDYTAWNTGLRYFTIPGHVRTRDVPGFSIYAHKVRADFLCW